MGSGKTISSLKNIRISFIPHLVLLNGMFAILAAAGLQSLVAQRLKTHAGYIKAGRLLGVAHPKGDVVEAEETSCLWFGSLVGVAGLKWGHTMNSLIIRRCTGSSPF